MLLTHNHPSVVYPETALTFRIETPVLINTTRAPQVFRYVAPNDYQRPAEARAIPVRRSVPYYGPGYYPYSPYPYWGPYYGGYGLGVGIGFGRGWGRRW